MANTAEFIMYSQNMNAEFHLGDSGLGVAGDHKGKFLESERPSLSQTTDSSEEFPKFGNITQSTMPFTQGSPWIREGLVRGMIHPEGVEPSQLRLSVGDPNAERNSDHGPHYREGQFQSHSPIRQENALHGTGEQRFSQPLSSQIREHWNQDGQTQSKINPDAQIQGMLSQIEIIVSLQTNLMMSELQEAIDTLKIGPRATPNKTLAGGNSSNCIEIPGVSAVQRKALEDLDFIKNLLDLAKDDISSCLSLEQPQTNSHGNELQAINQDMDVCFNNLEWLLQKVAVVNDLQAQLRELRTEIKKVKDYAVAWDHMVQGALDDVARQQRQQRCSFYHMAIQDTTKAVALGKKAKLLHYHWKPSTALVAKHESCEDSNTRMDSGEDLKAQRYAKSFINAYEKQKEVVLKKPNSEKSSLDPDKDIPQERGYVCGITTIRGTGQSGRPVKGVRTIPRSLFNKYRAPLGSIGEEHSQSKLEEAKLSLSKVSSLLRIGTGTR